MTDKSISIILGRGTEGCGVTKFTIEQYNWLVSTHTDRPVDIYVVADKKWTRATSHVTDHFKQVKFKDDVAVDAMIKSIHEKSDYVIINSLPPIKSDERVIKNFSRMIEEFEKSNTKMVLIQHDHSKLSIRRNACLDESIKAASAIFSHSHTNDFSLHVKEVTQSGGLSGFLDEETTAIYNFQPGMDFDSIRKKYWKDIKDQDPKHNKWIGRTTSWKGYKQMFKFHDNYLRPNGYLTTLEGIERSPAYLAFRELGEFEGDVNTNASIESYDLSQKYGKCLQVFGPYNNHDMLERMSHVAFGYQLSLLKDRFINRSIEYTHAEVVCSGVIPVFRKQYGKQCTHREFGDPLIECKDNGTVWLGDGLEMQEAYDLIERLSKDDVLRDEYREQAFEFYRSHQDSEFTFKELHKKIEVTI